MAAQPLTLMENPSDRKARGAYFTPPVLADFLARWAIHGNRSATVLDPTCGEGVFVLAAARELRKLGNTAAELSQQVCGVDVHGASVRETMARLEAEELHARILDSDFFELASPNELLPSIGLFDAVIGNPPFVRYQQHIGQARRISVQAALRQGVRLSGLASSWAALLVHAGAFLAPDGRLAMVMPAELLTVGYAEPVRQWLRRRFAAVKLVFFERHQFAGALENVVLLLAQGTGGCDAFSLYYVPDGEDLAHIQPFDEYAVTLADEGKWTDLMLSIRQRQVFKAITQAHFASLSAYGSPELGTVTGANWFFAMNEETRLEFSLVPGDQVVAISPPGTRHLRGMSFTKRDWAALRDSGEAVWLLYPSPADDSPSLRRYLQVGINKAVPEAYKCQIRDPWWRPPLVPLPDLFFTYMSHRFPRLITNGARVGFVNSMHGVRLKEHTGFARQALPLLAMNSVTMLGAEIYGRSYGGGILKMEPREAARLPLPAPVYMAAAWDRLERDRKKLDAALREGQWTSVVERVDEVLLGDILSIPASDVTTISGALQNLRRRRISRDPSTTSVAISGG